MNNTLFSSKKYVGSNKIIFKNHALSKELFENSRTQKDLLYFAFSIFVPKALRSMGQKVDILKTTFFVLGQLTITLFSFSSKII